MVVCAAVITGAQTARAQPQVEARAAEVAPERQSYPTIKLGGYTQLQYTYAMKADADGEHDRDTLSIRSAVVQVSGDLTKRFRYKVQVSMQTPALEDAWVEYEYFPGHVVRVGQMYTLFGLENPTSGTDRLTINRSSSSVLGRGPDVRDIGIGLIGKFNFWDGFDLKYGITGVNGAGRNVDLDRTPEKDLWSRAFFEMDSPLGVWSVGGSFGYGHALRSGDPDTEMDDKVSAFYRVGSILGLKNRFVTATSELIYGHDKDTPEFDFVDPEARAAFAMGTDHVRSVGGYLQSVIHLPSSGLIGRADWINPDRGGEDDRIYGVTGGAFYDIEGGVGRVLVNYDHQMGPGAQNADRILAWLQAVF
jgi:hypothetical protein